MIDYRRSLLPEAERETYIAGDAFKKDWIEQIRAAHPNASLLITASGLFYYFEEEQVLSLIRMLQNYGDVELLFDTVNKSGMTMMPKEAHENSRARGCADVLLCRFRQRTGVRNRGDGEGPG